MKMYICRKNHQIIVNLIEKIFHKFWKSNILSANDEVQKVKKIYYYTNIVTKLYSTSVFMTAHGYTLGSIFRGNRSFGMSIWVPEIVTKNFSVFIIFVLIQFITISISTITGLLQMDVLFLTLIAGGIGQLKLLKFQLLSIKKHNYTGEAMTKLAACIDHQNMLFE